MKTIAKFFNVDNEFNYPSYFIEEVRIIPDEETFSNEWFETTEEEVNIMNDSHQEEKTQLFNIWQENQKNELELRITSLISFNYVTIPIHKLDFTQHLTPNVNLQKMDVPFVNGRPVYSLYQYEGQDIAKRTFEFEIANFLLDGVVTELCTRRIEKLGYFNLNGNILPQFEFILSDETYCIDIEYHKMQMLRERDLVLKNIEQQAQASLITPI